MLDIALFREHPDRVREGLSAKGSDPAVVDQVLRYDEERRALVGEIEGHRARRNEISKQIPERAKQKLPIEDLKTESRTLGDRITVGDARLLQIETELEALLLVTPNLPHATTPRGRTPEDNVVTRTWGEKRSYGFTPKGHWVLGEELGILEIARAVKISGSGFYALKGLGSKLERVLIGWMLDEHTRMNGYTEFATPHLVLRKTMIGTGQLPKHEEDMYAIAKGEHYLIPTAEVTLTNLLCDEILDEAQLPIRHVGHTPCYRQEAGSYGKESRGMSRVHQFNKVEMVMFETPENSYAAHEELTSHATWFLEQLGLPYRVLNLCTGDMSSGAAKCYDIEVWAPGMDAWLEVSSCSNFEDYQARRAGIRYRPADGGRPRFVHTLNGSGLAMPRLIIALLENYQREDGSIELPGVLHDRMGATEIRA
jgi:seryl-tRNA synthetase